MDLKHSFTNIMIVVIGIILALVLFKILEPKIFKPKGLK